MYPPNPSKLTATISVPTLGPNQSSSASLSLLSHIITPMDKHSMHTTRTPISTPIFLIPLPLSASPGNPSVAPLDSTNSIIPRSPFILAVYSAAHPYSHTLKQPSRRNCSIFSSPLGTASFNAVLCDPMPYSNSKVMISVDYP